MREVREFRAAARQTSGSVVAFILATSTTPSFHQGVIAYEDRTMAAVCDRNAPLAAVARPRVVEGTGVRDSGPLSFLDVPESSATLKARLGAPSSHQGRAGGHVPPRGLTAPRARDVEYWRPVTVDEALFNHWA
jgi:hypothetical protein